MGRHDRQWTLASVVIAVAAVSVTAARPARAGGPTRLREAVKLALARHERARQAQLRVDAAEGSRERARAAFLPSLALGANVAGDATADPRTGRHWTTAGTLTLTQPIVSPSAWPLYAQAEHNVDAERANSLDDLRQLAYDTAKSYIQTLASEQVVAAAKGRLARAKANLDDTQARASAGLVSTNDVTRAQLDVASALQSVTTQEATGKRARIALETLVGEEITGELEPPDTAERADAMLAEGIDRLAQGAPARRADVRAAHESAEAARLFAEEPLYRIAPTVGVSGQLRANGAPAAPFETKDAVVTFSLTWPIFDGGARYGDRRQRLAQAESARLGEQLLRRSVSADVRSAFIAFSAAREALRISEEAVATATRNGEETAVLYRQGLAKAIELTDANQSRFDAEVTRVQATLNLEQAAIDLRFALGLDPVDGVEIDPSTSTRTR